MYCVDKECRESDYKIGHKKSCGRPPMLSTAPDKDEVQFCVDIFKDNPASVPSVLTWLRSAIATLSDAEQDEQNADGADAWEDDEDDSSWETVDSGEEADEDASEPSKTSIIDKFFKAKTYY